MPADDLTDPAPANTFAHLDATTVLARSIAELGIYPAVDPLASTSRMLDPLVCWVKNIIRLPVVFRRFCSVTKSYRILLPFLVWTSCRKTRKMLVNRARKVQRFLSQPFNVAEQFTGLPGKYVQLSDTIQGFKEILDGKHDEIPKKLFLKCRKY